MSTDLRRGACPSLSAPMQTGDGLLARLNPADGALTGHQLAGVADAAEAFGNGQLEISARGNLQIRGLTRTSAGVLADAVAELGIAVHPGIEVRTGALAGLDAGEIADPLRIAQAIRKRALPLADRLAPKLSVVIDGGGALPLHVLVADVRLRAISAREWLVEAGRTVVGTGGPDAAVDAAIFVLDHLSERGPGARGRDLDDAAISAVSASLKPTPQRAPAQATLPVGRFPLRDGRMARGIALAFGQIDASSLRTLAQAAESETVFRLAPGRGLLVLNMSEAEERTLVETATRLGLVTEASDPRLRIVTCAGAPACASAHLATKAIAAALAMEIPDGSGIVHLSGCAKQCANPRRAAATLIGGAQGYEIETKDDAMRARLKRIAESHGAAARRRSA
ncbi:precorrin-3B synthase [Neoaquamicrobium sediminum]|uniref:precorrin-3B synthase n=1 Tax=Neoaquamicrobium sediminum TaxID=1849104 RepID=UPI001567C3D2|nr:precorrin-3B synthase [Mesorhizobium sediminum]NRC55368.1 precorrin-3B synthase [Mesorhizobium sediminum]